MALGLKLNFCYAFLSACDECYQGGRDKCAFPVVTVISSSFNISFNIGFLHNTDFFYVETDIVSA